MTERFGHFDDAAREYVITRPDTPLPWINYLGAGEHVGIISNTGGGYAFHRDARLRRLTRHRYNAPSDQGGRYVYVRDDDSGDVWSPSWQPVGAPVDDYRCRHGLGYTAIASSRGGIGVEATYFVPLDADVEVWRVRVTNERTTAATLSLFGAVEFCLWDAADDASNLQRTLSTGEVAVVDGVIFHTTEYRERRDHVAYFACSEPTAGFDTQRDAFLGAYRGWDRPVVVETGATTGSIAHGWSPIGAHHVELALAPGASRDVVFLLGYWENPSDAKYDAAGALNTSLVRPVIDRWCDAGEIDGAVAALRDHWGSLLDRLQVSTPNEHVDRMLNTWNAYQCMVTCTISRSASMFETGIGRGMGFRDSCQDLLGYVHLVPDRSRERLLDLAATQLPSGAAYHQYQPLTKRGNDAIGSGFNDDPLWLVLAVAAYVKETGDRALLDEPVPYDNAAGSEAPMREHLQRAVQHTLDRLGPHGLPLIGRADWNDCLNLNCFSETPGESFQTTENRSGGHAESVFLAGLFALAADELAALVPDDAPGLRDAAAAMRAAVGEHGWDGAWFRRAYDHHGGPVGSATNDEGRIYVEAQGMCVMAGIGVDDGRARAALDSVAEHLTTPHGIALLAPAYTRYRIELGEISSYPPGYKENGGVFCHTNPWVVIAETIAGDPDRALAHHLRINPSVRAAISDVHRCEPYVYAQMIAGPSAATHGEAKNSWLTGAAAWSYVAATQWILGVRPEHEGLRIDPRLPSAWDGFTMCRVLRGATYDIRVRRGDVASLTVDGVPVDGVIVPFAPAGTTVVVDRAIPR